VTRDVRVIENVGKGLIDGTNLIPPCKNSALVGAWNSTSPSSHFDGSKLEGVGCLRTG
jgi:hypothetical protein